MLHINVLELKAVKLAFLILNKQKTFESNSFSNRKHHCTTYPVKMVKGCGRGRGVKRDREQNVPEYFLKHQIAITIEYLPSTLDVEKSGSIETAGTHQNGDFA